MVAWFKTRYKQIFLRRVFAFDSGPARKSRAFLYSYFTEICPSKTLYPDPCLRSWLFSEKLCSNISMTLATPLEPRSEIDCIGRFPSLLPSFLKPSHSFFYAEKEMKDKMSPAVKLEELPKTVLKIFSSQIQGSAAANKRIPIADLSNVDKKLVGTLLSFQREAVE